MRKLMIVAVMVLAGVAVAAAQQANQASTCEVQLEEARAINVSLRKQKAQADFASAALEEALTLTQKRLTDAEAKNKAAAADKK